MRGAVSVILPSIGEVSIVLFNFEILFLKAAPARRGFGARSPKIIKRASGAPSSVFNGLVLGRFYPRRLSTKASRADKEF